jgi:hypothetical protein
MSRLTKRLSISTKPLSRRVLLHTRALRLAFIPRFSHQIALVYAKALLDPFAQMGQTLQSRQCPLLFRVSTPLSQLVINHLSHYGIEASRRHTW